MITEEQVREVLERYEPIENLIVSQESVRFTCKDFNYEITDEAVRFKSDARKSYSKRTHDSYKAIYVDEEDDIDKSIGELITLLTSPSIEQSQPEPTLEEKVKAILESKNGLKFRSLSESPFCVMMETDSQSYKVDAEKVSWCMFGEPESTVTKDIADYERTGSYRETVSKIAALLKQQQPVSEVEQLKARVAELEKELRHSRIWHNKEFEKNIEIELACSHLSEMLTKEIQDHWHTRGKLSGTEKKIDGLMADVRAAEQAYEDEKSKREDLQNMLDSSVSEVDHEREMENWQTAFEQERRALMDQTRLATKYRNWFEEAHAERLQLKSSGDYIQASGRVKREPVKFDQEDVLS